ncbi:hypothetical protein RSal33209_1294 [Renibacterium salmoninarum ATCC 33209]|uniref:Uncharacterized protein n=1 Tax=Renibacterium salmoninarum (strain ATCC 33209 / DSM 20767 / JCM 11484 / NBRC 15589 / NCIMB 2235) TaxID=288705 RepID=A9WPN7_RENSM|nr:hypothetical protein RSal33209_1294 [Renibacterium salmoninarum ATCC 33209]
MEIEDCEKLDGKFGFFFQARRIVIYFELIPKVSISFV